MKANLKYLKDNLGQNFIGLTVYQDSLVTYLKHLEEVLGDKFEQYTKNQKKRDLGSYHINVISASEYNELTKKFGADKIVNTLESILDKEIDFTMIGLGKAQAYNNLEYFVVVKSEMLSEVRRIFGLKEKDFTVLLGFYPGEVFGVRKNILVPQVDPFLKLLSQNYYNSNNSFDFLKELEFFEYDHTKQIDVIKIEESFATFRIEQDYFTVSLIGDKLSISAKWQETKNKPRLSDTIISRKLKNI
jgi:hypothetical protein